MTESRRAFRFAIVAAAPLAACLGVACGDDDSLPTSSNDAGTSPETSIDGAPLDSSHTDSDTGVDAGGVTSNLVLANDVTSVASNVRFCVLSSTTTDVPTIADVVPSAPQPSAVTGLAPGRLTRLAVPFQLSTRSARLVMLYTSSLDAFNLSAKTCADIGKELRTTAPVAPDGGDAGPPPPTGGNPSGMLLEGADFEFGEIFKRGALKDASRYIVLATGCPRATTNDSIGECGGTYDKAVTQFRTYAYELDPTAAATATKNRAQFIYGSNSLERQGPAELFGFVRYSDGTDGGFTSDPILGPDDGGVFFTAATGPAQPKPGTEVRALSTSLSFAYTPFPGAPPQATLTPDILRLSDLTAGDLKAGKAYTFLVFGSPFVPRTEDGGTNPKFLHAALVPND